MIWRGTGGKERCVCEAVKEYVLVKTESARGSWWSGWVEPPRPKSANCWIHTISWALFILSLWHMVRPCGLRGTKNVSSKIIKKPTEKKLNKSFCDICIRTIVYLISRIKCWQACYDLTHGVTNLLAWLDPHLGCEQEWGWDSHSIPQLTSGWEKEQTSKLGMWICFRGKQLCGDVYLFRKWNHKWKIIRTTNWRGWSHPLSSTSLSLLLLFSTLKKVIKVKLISTVHHLFS